MYHQCAIYQVRVRCDPCYESRPTQPSRAARHTCVAAVEQEAVVHECNAQQEQQTPIPIMCHVPGAPQMRPL